MVMCLQRALYRMKQAGSCWWMFFSVTLEKLGFIATEVEKSFYIFKQGGNTMAFWIHMDNGLIVSDSLELVAAFRWQLEETLKITWSASVDRIVTLLPPTSAVAAATDPIVAIDSTEYQSVLGEISDVACGTRPDMSHLVTLLAGHSAGKTEQHWEALDHLVGYLQMKWGAAMVFSRGEDVVALWTDAGWEGDYERSQTGYILTFCGFAILWGSCRKMVVDLSTCASEYVSLLNSKKYLMQALSHISDLGLKPPTQLRCDHEAAVNVSLKNKSHTCTRYLNTEFVCE
ncbi:hypothetical protein O181_007094 [Austropuccinia psidii MF-1]|uniref:Reverse transcriptase Ty1/copia-type domain-containing protein n=1 Tax=Austropuccinia psidii MF-1 TaxID=1389203 RepID=A0A9Q3GHI7_9BASI|nr:hypothetical protein [Austropuccinia psidii MF-1]